MSIDEIALAITAYLCVVLGNRVAKAERPVMALAVLAVYIIYLLYFMVKSVWCFFGK